MLLGSKLGDLQGGAVSEGPTCPRARARERRVIDGLSTGYRRVMLATYVRVNHWADFDGSYSEGKRGGGYTVEQRRTGEHGLQSVRNFGQLDKSKTGQNRYSTGTFLVLY